MKKRSFFSIFLFSLSFSVFSEMFRVDAVVPVKISENLENQKAELGINDALAVYLPVESKNMAFVKGIELSIKIPSVVGQWQDSVAYSVFENVSPKPSAKTIDFEGKKLYLDTLPSRLSTSIYIPLSEGFSIKETPYSKKIPVVFSTESGYVFLRLQLAMKGVPDEIERAKFEITAKPVLSDEGRLVLKIKKPEIISNEITGTPYLVYLDEKTSEFVSDEKINLENEVILKTGDHHLSVVSDFFRNEARSFKIDQGKTTVVEIDLRDIAPVCKILAPENVEIVFDGEVLGKEGSEYQGVSPSEGFVVKPGEHTVTFKIGNYEIVKTFTAENGRGYNVNLSIDAEIAEVE